MKRERVWEKFGPIIVMRHRWWATQKWTHRGLHLEKITPTTLRPLDVLKIEKRSSWNYTRPSLIPWKYWNQRWRRCWGRWSCWASSNSAWRSQGSINHRKNIAINDSVARRIESSRVYLILCRDSCLEETRDLKGAVLTDFLGHYRC